MNIFVKANINLKEHLESLGYLFPCGGKGLCGRCKVIAPKIPPTSLDYRFLTDSQIESGVRLACDKYVKSPMDIVCELSQKPKDIRPIHPGVYAIFEDDFTEIGLTDDGIIIERVSLQATKPSKSEIKAQFNFHAIELFEKYGVAKATTILIMGTSERIKALTEIDLPILYGDMYYAIDYQLPGEDLYITPIPVIGVGSSDIVELLDIPKNTLVISNSSFMYTGDDILCVTIGEKTENWDKAYRATLRYFVEKFKPKDIISFNTSAEVTKYGGRFVERRARYIAAELMISNKKKAELNKIAKRIVTMALADDDEWQNIFTNA